MAIFPKVQSPCPYKANLSAIMDGSMCRMCKREVVDLSGMNDAQRVALIEGCDEEVCVSYTLPIRQTVAAAMMGAALTAAPAYAQDAHGAQEPIEGELCLDELDDRELVMIVVGGIKDKTNVEYIDTAEDLAIPELPVTYEDDPIEEASLRSETDAG